MNLRLASIIRKEFIQIIRDPRTMIAYYRDADPPVVPAWICGNHGCKKYPTGRLGSKPDPTVASASGCFSKCRLFQYCLYSGFSKMNIEI